MRGRHYPRQDRMEQTARLHAMGKVRSKRTAPAMTPERAAMMECAEAIRKLRSTGQRVSDEMHRQYSALLAAYHATLTA